MKSKTIRIFIIDDDKLLTMALKNEIVNNFPKENVAVSTFEAGEFLVMTEAKPDIAIIDYHLDGRYKDAMNGIEAIDFIRLQSPDTQIILFTGDDNIGIAVEAFQHGAHDFVLKNDHLFRRINVALVQCLNTRRLRRELRRQRVRSLAACLIIGALLGIVTLIEFILPQLSGKN